MLLREDGSFKCFLKKNEAKKLVDEGKARFVRSRVFQLMSPVEKRQWLQEWNKRHAGLGRIE
jgi:hypothetical protein